MGVVGRAEEIVKSNRTLKMDFQPFFMAGRSLSRGHKGFFRNKVRPEIIPRDEPACSICGFKAAERRLIHADELWDFPGPPHVRLVEIRPLCVYCHDAKDYWHLLLRVQSGIAVARLAGVVQDHYCNVNSCTPDEFSEDYKLALTQKRKLEELYGNGYDRVVEVDYGKWMPPQRLGAAVGLLSSLPPEEKDAMVAAIRRERRRSR